MGLSSIKDFGYQQIMKLQKVSTFERKGSKKWSKSDCFRPPGCEIEILKIRDDFIKQPRDS